MRALADFDPFDLDVVREPHAFHAALRREAPLYRMPNGAWYLISRYRREDETPSQVILSSTGIGVFLNTLTIMASFGALMVAHHQGVFSIGAVMSLGMVACQVAFIIVLPAVLTLFGRK